MEKPELLASHLCRVRVESRVIKTVLESSRESTALMLGLKLYENWTNGSGDIQIYVIFKMTAIFNFPTCQFTVIDRYRRRCRLFAIRSHVFPPKIDCSRPTIEYPNNIKHRKQRDHHEKSTVRDQKSSVLRRKSTVF